MTAKASDSGMAGQGGIYRESETPFSQTSDTWPHPSLTGTTLIRASRETWKRGGLPLRRWPRAVSYIANPQEIAKQYRPLFRVTPIWTIVRLDQQD